MSFFDNLKEVVRSVFNRADAAEWDANDPAGDESAYDGFTVEYAPFDYRQFEEEGR